MMVIICMLAWVFASYLLIGKQTGIANPVLKAVLSFYFSISVLSFGFSGALFAGIHFIAFEVVFLVVPLVFILLELKKAAPGFFSLSVLKNTSFLRLLVILSGLCFFSYTFFTLCLRWGEWDAWAIWSQHAKFLTFDPEFNNLFNDKIDWTHPDYPLMLPSIVALFWKSLGSFSPYVPALFSYFVGISLVLLVLTPFLEKKSKLLGIVLFLVLTCSSVLFPFVAGQYADTLLASFILIPLVLLSLLPNSKPLFYFSLIGFFAASCGWTKNEGLMYFAIFSFCFFLKYLRQPKFLLYYGLGALLPVAIIMVFKLNFATSNYLMQESRNSYLEKFTDWSRYELISNYAFTYLSENCQFLWLSMLVILIINYRFYLSFAFWVIFLLLVSYFYAYVFSPFGLEWHMSTSFDRLIHQVFPALIYAVFFSAMLKFSKSTSKNPVE